MEKSQVLIDDILEQDNDNDGNSGFTFQFHKPVESLKIDDIRRLVIQLPGRPPAILDRNLAEIYGTKTKRLIEQLKRNEDWFDSDFFYEMTSDEFAVANCDHKFENGSKIRYSPKMFTHYGCNAAAFLVHTPQAYKMRKLIIKVFTELDGGGIKIKITDFSQLVRDAAAFRMQTKNLNSIKMNKLLRYIDAGLNNTEIGTLLGVSKTTARQWRQSITEMQLYSDLPDGPQQLNLI